MRGSIYQDNPCTNCKPPTRHLGCHADCPIYKSWRETVEERKAKYWEDRSKADMLDSMEKARSQRRERRRHSR